jgi:hypothetical protein
MSFKIGDTMNNNETKSKWQEVVPTATEFLEMHLRIAISKEERFSGNVTLDPNGEENTFIVKGLDRAHKITKQNGVRNIDPNSPVLKIEELSKILEKHMAEDEGLETRASFDQKGSHITLKIENPNTLKAEASKHKPVREIQF